MIDSLDLLAIEREVHQQELNTAPLLDHYCTDFSSKRHQQQKLAVLLSRIFWLHLCVVRGT